MAEQEERCIQSQRAELPQVMMMISIVPLQKQTELGSIYLEERESTYLGDTRQETQYEDIDTALKRPFFYPALPFPNPALRSPPSPSLLLILEPCPVSTICDRPRPPLLKLCCLSMP